MNKTDGDKAIERIYREISSKKASVQDVRKGLNKIDIIRKENDKNKT